MTDNFLSDIKNRNRCELPRLWEGNANNSKKVRNKIQSRKCGVVCRKHTKYEKSTSIVNKNRVLEKKNVSLMIQYNEMVIKPNYATL